MHQEWVRKAAAGGVICGLLALMGCRGDPPGDAAPPAPPAYDPASFHVIAHRGASAYAPENTFPAYRLAFFLGVAEVELDVQRSRDGVLVLFHDDTLDRKTNRSGRIRDYSAAELRQTDIGSWFDREHPQVEQSYAGTPLTLLDDLWGVFGDRFHYHVEMKAPDPEIPAELLATVRAHGLERRVTLTSFHTEQLARLRRLAPRIRLCLLIRTDLGASIEAAAREGYQQVGLRASDLTPALVQQAVSAGLEIRAWKVQSEADVIRVLEAGATGMTVDWPDRAGKIVHRFRERTQSR